MYKVAKVVIGENHTFLGGERYLKDRGVEVVLLDNSQCKDMMSSFIKDNAAVWYAISL